MRVRPFYIKKASKDRVYEGLCFIVDCRRPSNATFSSCCGRIGLTWQRPFTCFSQRVLHAL